MKKIRTIRQAADEFRAADPQTPITQSLLRRMIAEGTIPYAKTGNKYLLDFDILEQVLAGKYHPITTEPLNSAASGSFAVNKVRKIGE